MKRVYLVHGWGGNPDNNWFPWLKKELEKKGYNVFSLKMPNPDKPEINEWNNFLTKSVGKIDENTYFVGHSIGCLAIINYLENCKRRIGCVVLVAPWFRLTGLETDEEKRIAKPWLDRKINYKKIKINNLVAIFSDNDPFVPLKINSEIYKNKLNAKIIVKHRMGHFDDEAGIKKLPEVLKELIKMTE